MNEDLLELAISAMEAELATLRESRAILTKYSGKSTVKVKSVPITATPTAPAPTPTAINAPKSKGKRGGFKGGMSPEGKARVAAAQKLRWANVAKEKKRIAKEAEAKVEAKRTARAASKPSKSLPKLPKLPPPTKMPKPALKPMPKLPVKPKAATKVAAKKVKAVRFSDSVSSAANTSAVA